MCALAVLIVLPMFVTPAYADTDKITVVIDAGHGGVDGGTDLGIRTEKEYNLTLATYLAEELRQNAAFEVVLTRSDDTYLKFLPRALSIIENNADVLISLHCNSSDVTSASGTLAIVSKIEPYHTEAAALADKILDSISNAVSLNRGKVETRADTGDELGVYYWSAEHQWDMPSGEGTQTSDYFSMNTWSSKFGTPSIIVEHGYLSNEYDRTVLDDDENLRKIAHAEAEAIIEFYTGHTHLYPAEPTVDYPSSCTLVGTKSYRCTVCGKKTGTVSLPADTNAHYWREISRKNATCTEDGVVEYICQISDNLNGKGYTCDVHTKTEVITATGHTYEVVEDTPAAHGRDGHYLRKCTTCGDVIDEIREGEAHDYKITSDIKPTCTKDGGTTYTCTICAETYTDVIPATGHEYAEIERREVSGDENGYIKYRCTICGDVTEEILHACEHVYGEKSTTPATCDTDGIISEECTVCGYVHEEAIPKTGHDMQVLMDVAASCESEGYYRAKCTVCGYIENRSRPALGHNYIIKEKNGTHVTKSCTRCGSEITEEVTRRSLKTIFDNPLLTAALLVIVVQLIAIPVILIRHRRHLKNRLRPTSDTETEEALETDETKIL